MKAHLLFAGLLALSVVPALAFGQALSGTYTCANGNPGNAFDYADIGGFFNDLEDFGINGPVTLELYDDGGDFTSKESYQLGFDGNDPLFSMLRPVAGIGPANTLTIRAAQGEYPTITGRGAAGLGTSILDYTARGGMGFAGIGYITIEGLEIRDTDFGIAFMSYGTYFARDIRIARCRFHAITRGVAIRTTKDSSLSEPFHNMTIEGNMFWDCTTLTGSAGWGIVDVNYCGSNCTIRNNTVVLIQAFSGNNSAVSYRPDNGNIPVSELVGNIIYFDHASNIAAYDFSGFAPPYADRNVFCVKGAAKLFPGVADWAWWQSQGCDLNGLNTDPLFMSVAPGQVDPRLRPDSPAVDLIPASALTADVFGNPRPYGTGYDSGAHELQNFGARAAVPAGSAFAGPADGPFDLTVDYGDTLANARIELTDAEGDAITVASITPPTPNTADIAAPALPPPGQPLMLEWTGTTTDPPGAYTWMIEYADAGNGFVLTCEVNITINPPPPIVITTATLPDGRVGTAYNQTIQTADATGAVTFSVLGALPPGMTLAAGTGAITGTPTQEGTFNFTVQVADSFNTATQAYDVQVLPAPARPDPGTGGEDSGCALSPAQPSSPGNRALALAALVLLVGIAGVRCRAG